MSARHTVTANAGFRVALHRHRIRERMMKAFLAVLAGAMLLVPLAQAAPAGQDVKGVGPKVTGSMYNGNNADPPDLGVSDRQASAPASGSADTEGPTTGNKGGNSVPGRTGGGG
jgi:hypothetical protein